MLAIGFLIGACTSEGGTSREQVLSDLATQTIVPSYEVMVTRSQDLVRQVDNACSASTPENRTAVLESLDDTRQAWKETEAMWIGPVMDGRSWALIDYPINTSDIDKVLTNTSLPTIDHDVVSRRVGADERGLAAIEYLLSGDIADQRRCAYMRAAAITVDTEAKRVLAAWTNSTGNAPAYRSVLAGDDASNDVDMTLDTIVNDQINLLRTIGDTELGAALGNESKPADPDAIAEARPGQVIDIERARLSGVRLVLVGDVERTGLSPLLDDALQTRVEQAIETADVALSNVDGSIRDALVSDRSDLETAKKAVDDLRRVLTTEVVSHLGVAVGFSDNDGDSSK